VNTGLRDYMNGLMVGRATAGEPLASVRAQARLIGTSPGQLSRMLNGHLPITEKMAGKIAAALGRTAEEQAEIKTNLGRLQIKPPEIQKRRPLKDLPSRTELEKMVQELEEKVPQLEAAVIASKERLALLREILAGYEDIQKATDLLRGLN
jgi:hypothetical protein